MEAQERGSRCETLGQQWLRNSHGIRTIRASYYAPFDLFTEKGTTLEVKGSFPTRPDNKSPITWGFNIHRHGEMPRYKPDFYILRLEMPRDLKYMLGLSYACHLVIPSGDGEVNHPTLRMSVRGLITRYAKYFNAVEPILVCDGRKTLDDLKEVLIRANVGNVSEAVEIYEGKRDYQPRNRKGPEMPLPEGHEVTCIHCGKITRGKEGFLPVRCSNRKECGRMFYFSTEETKK